MKLENESEAFNLVVQWDQESVDDLFEAVRFIYAGKHDLFWEYLGRAFRDLAQSQNESGGSKWNEAVGVAQSLSPPRVVLAVDKHGNALSTLSRDVSAAGELHLSVDDLLILGLESKQVSRSHGSS